MTQTQPLGVAHPRQRKSAAPTVLTFLGAAGCVTGSKHLVTHGDARVLVDCGLFQGERGLRRRNWEPFPVDARALSAVVITHAHLDHTGYLPRLVREGFAGPIYCTHGTAALTTLVLRDAAHLQEEDAAYARHAGFSRHDPPRPLYRAEDAELAIARLTPRPFEEFFPVADDVRVRLRPAGHILGSSFVELEAGTSRVTFSGDLGRDEHPLLRAPARPRATDVLVVESTYGDRVHPPAPEQRLAEAIRRTVARGGVCLLPAFAVDRTPLLLHVLAGLVERGEVPDVPVYVDSPMALSALDVYRAAIARRDDQFRPEVLDSRAPLMPRRTGLLSSVAESKTLNAPGHPCIVLSASGMATGGRVLHHLSHQLPQPRNSVILTGFQVAGTRGRALADGVGQVKIHGRYVPVRAEVVTVEGFSVHADADQLVAWAGSTKPHTAFVVHGEPRSSAALRDRLEHEAGLNAVVPRPGERVRVDPL